jgi:sugar O-acyltransferase (sialic acid O-acetyltransferase NeuD family)
MTRPLVVFGIGQWAELADFYFRHDSPYEVAAFTVDRDYLDGDTFQGRPVVAWDEVERAYPPTSVSLFVPISFKRMNHIRAEKVKEAKARGYELVSYVSSKATTFPDFSCGENCFILENNAIQPRVKIGRNVVMWTGNYVGHHTVIEDHVMIAAHVAIAGACHIGEYSFLGVNSTIRDETVIGRETVVGAGAVILSDTAPFSVHKVDGTQPTDFQSHQIRTLSHKADN